ncbi:MAG: putative molybdenum carrier protein, partial [Desulfovermiculus sp.]
MNEHQIFQKIISGGQTGADQGALDAALELGHPCGGWCPKGRRSEAGPISQRYPVTEHSSESYQARTEANIIDSDGTLVFTCREPTGGTKETIDLARKHGKPYLILDLEKGDPNSDLELIRKWGRENQVTVLNVAGPRESKNPGISARVKQTILHLLSPV